MKTVKTSFEILSEIPLDILEKLELYGRVCYKSEERISPGSAERFLKLILKNQHLSVLEHFSVTVRFICDRATSHQLVRHRLASYSQESQRYVKYKEALPVIVPEKIKNNYEALKLFGETIDFLEKAYSSLVDLGIPPEDARAILPNAVKTEIIVTCNLREWLHIFEMRCDRHAQSTIRYLMLDLLMEFRKRIPIVFDHLLIDEEKGCIRF